MGMFDEIILDLDIECHKCGHTLEAGHVFQTKDFMRGLDRYKVVHGRVLHCRGFQWNLDNQEEWGEPEFEPMPTGHPHQWVNAYDHCPNCKTWIDLDLKFTDGVLISAKVRHEED